MSQIATRQVNGVAAVIVEFEPVVILAPMGLRIVLVLPAIHSLMATGIGLPPLLGAPGEA